MRWTRGVRSAHVEDRRGAPRGRKKLAFGGGGVVIVIVALLLGADPSQIMSLLGGGGGGGGSTTAPGPDTELSDFAHFLHEDMRKVWEKKLPRDYRHPRLVLFTQATNTACGYSTSAIGPFYCPADKTAYIDLSFFQDLSRKLGAPGDFAQAYVLGHELGHHIQNLLGTSRAMRQMQQRNPSQKNALSVKLELQADCYSGVWAHSTKQRNLLERGDLEEALGAAAAIGDDRLQKSAGRRPHPETFTHGTSAQRSHWFKVGFESGDPRACDTFSAVQP